MAVPAVESAGAQPKASGATGWAAPQNVVWRPSSHLSSPGSGIQAARRVACDLCPDPIDFTRPPYALQTLQTVLRVRFPQHTPDLVSRYGRAEYVPLSPPKRASIPWRAAIVTGMDLSPNQVFPARPARPTMAHSRAPRRISVRLFQVPRAMPMAVPAGGRPLALGMDSWASPPAIRAFGLRFDDGMRRSGHTASQRFSQELRDRFSQADLRSAWMKLSRLPSDFRWIAMAVPLVLGIWAMARPASTEPVKTTLSMPQEEPPVVERESQAAVAPVSSPLALDKKAAVRAAKPITGVVPPAEPGRWDVLTARIAGRASVDLVEDFRNGLSHWEGRGEWARSWSYDRSGIVRPGHMAIFQPTVKLRDYVLEMKASIDRRAIQWVVRASNSQNYHFTRLNVTPGAPLTKLELERWSVINGRTGRVTRLPLPHGGANQTLYSIRVEVRGDSITTYLQDQVIDTFSDARLQEGGVGLIGTHEDRPRIYGIHVFHQNDFLGKLCSFLAPPPINSQGSD
jgi:hypothetical protein